MVSASQSTLKVRQRGWGGAQAHMLGVQVEADQHAAELAGAKAAGRG
jgi:hypothetical protein